MKTKRSRKLSKFQWLACSHALFSAVKVRTGGACNIFVQAARASLHFMVIQICAEVCKQIFVHSIIQELLKFVCIQMCIAFAIKGSGQK